MYDPFESHSTFADAWFRFPASIMQSAAAANRAAMAAFVSSTNGETDTVSPFSDSEHVPGVPSVAYDELDWEFERSVDRWEDLSVGDTVTFGKELDEDDVAAFAQSSGDTNRLHLDEAFAEKTRFEGKIVHGTLVGGVISAALARLPGITIYLSQDLEFRHPVQLGDHVTAHVEIIEDLGENQYCLSTVVRNDTEEKTIIDGEAIVLIDELPTESSDSALVDT